ncbi:MULTISPECIES: argininosuccinate lyase [Streptomyces]|uniref:Argininosuccinate lyase n=1 Tax=Streptomyces parvus TaxID=66428 RepID=A0A5D4JPK8_9ACTN|nr:MULTISPECIES: argininosuccinate lyase [Streptomyces]PVD04869.1 argininosuccinate lyase [Streptomyces sp. CS014]TYR66185.1 argininosuccinate lyase [Streptomyces parvus]
MTGPGTAVGDQADTGRLTATLGARTRSMVFGTAEPALIDGELELLTTIDLSHVVMLAERELLPVRDAAGILRHVTQLRENGFKELHHRPMPRGLYMMYENHLVSALGPETGGKLHTGRSRNDIKATTAAIRLREGLAELLSQALRLHAVLLCRARAYRHVVMPVYTHFQPAMPVTYGYYLVGVATALGRDIGALRHTLAELDRCPLGAGAVSGTDLPIDPARTAELLGFAVPAAHALDAVASRDTALRAVAGAAGVGLTLSRLATDLQLWSTQEFGFVEFPERLVGGSSAMPQKRNAFLLEHVKGRAGAAIGAWTGAAASMKSTPFTNSIEVGTEAVSDVWDALSGTVESVLLTQALVSGGRPVPERMAARAEKGFVTATVVANRLVRQGMPFRTAHHLVGAAVRRAVESGSTRLSDADLPAGGLPSLDEVAAEHRYGGGPGVFDASFDAERRILVDHAEWLLGRRECWAVARRKLDEAVAELLARPKGSGKP